MKKCAGNFIIAINTLKNSYNQVQIASKLGIQPQSLSQIMKGKRGPTVENISKLFTEFAINPIWILTGKGHMIENKYQLDYLNEPKKKHESKDELPAGPCQQCEIREKLIKSLEKNIELLEYKISKENKK